MALLLLLLTMLMFSSPSHEIQDPTTVIDRIVRDSAFRSYPKHHSKTAVLYNVSLPPSLSGVAADTARFRAGSLRRHGAEIKEFRISPGLVVHPHTKRLIVVRQNLGNLSSIYNTYLTTTSRQFHLISPVVGLLIYDAAFLGNSSDRRPELQILITKRPIVVDFSRVVGFSSENRSRCALFGLDGKTRVSNRVSGNLCSVRRQGHFALVIESSAVNGNCSVGSSEKENVNTSGWKVGVAGAVAGAIGVGLLGLMAVAVVKVKKRRWEMAEMERRAHEEAALQISMVGHMRTPVAPGARTAPTLEDEYAHPL